MKLQERIRVFIQEIWRWYGRNKRQLPWRDLDIEDTTERAYRVMVSEIMLQQTQVSRVIIMYRRFLEQFPHLEDLAQASNREVILAWRGLGYNSRALRLKDAAKHICNTSLNAQKTKQKVHFPQEMNELMCISGIGHYTAAAIRNFAFHIPTPCLDTNIRRILHRTFVGPENPDGTWKKDDRYLLQLAEEIVRVACHSHTTSEWHAALMDFGSLVQTKRNPRWEECPLTAAGIMKATSKNFPKVHLPTACHPASPTAVAFGRGSSSEPGRLVGSRHVPNRIFRGRIVETLRDCEKGLTLEKIGKEICIDWCSTAEQKTWLHDRLTSLKKDRLLMQRRGKFFLYT